VAREVAEAPRRAVDSAVQVGEDAAAERGLEGAVDEVEKTIREVDDPVRLEALERVERGGRQRKTVLEAIRARREMLSESKSAAA
jgi:hypothetical protein